MAGMSVPLPQTIPSVQQAPAVGGICIYPGCTKPVHVEPNGRTHQFCNRTHASMYHQSQAKCESVFKLYISSCYYWFVITDAAAAITPLPPHLKCSNPSCNRMRYKDNGQYYDYCGKSCRDSFRSTQQQQGQGVHIMIYIIIMLLYNDLLCYYIIRKI